MLDVLDLSIEFNSVKALSGVSLSVPDRSFVGLMGPNGAGKTTLINCVSRIYPPSTGEIKFDGTNLLKLSADEIVSVGIARTFQDLNFFNRIAEMSIIDYMRLGQFNPHRIHLFGDSVHSSYSKKYERELKKKARRILEFFSDVREKLEPPQDEQGYPFLLGREGFPDLLDIENKPIGSLSFAWRRRLDLARALVSDPKLLMLDEPAQGLPPFEIENLGRFLKLIKEEFKLSALIVEHNISALMAISDQIVVMNVGTKLADGSPSEVSQQPEVIRIYLGAAEADGPAKSAITQVTAASGPEKGTIVPLLEVRGIDAYYGSAQALFSVSLKIFNKQVVSILGTNGSGKSTLLKIISGGEKPKFGEIYLNGTSLITGWPELAVEYGIQYVPQGHIIFPELSVLDNLKIGAYFFEKRGLKFKTALERVFHYAPGLKDQLKLPAGSLSGGQQQMLAIAQAIIGRPKVLLLDEPTLGLAPILVDATFNTIQKICAEEDCSVILVEQNVSKAIAVSDYIYVLNSGVLVGEGTSQMLSQNDKLIKKYLGFT